MREVFNDSKFLRDFREAAATHTRGCIVLERPDVMKQLVEKHSAKDSTARGTAMPELDAMTPRPSQDNPGSEIPEKSWAYWLAKKIAFHEYGVYTKHFDAEQWKDTRVPVAEPKQELVKTKT